MEDWISSTEMRKRLKVSACELMHRRVRGELAFKKVGKAYFYQYPAEQPDDKNKDDSKS
jgi:hypothetical protein